MRLYRFSHVAIAGAAAALLCAAPVLRAQTADSLSAVTLNDEQVGRGDKVFAKVCIECHTKNDMSNADFRLKWNTRPVFDLFERVRTTMPDANPGSLTRDEYIDVVTYILKLNGAPSGGTALAPDSTVLRKSRMDLVAPKDPPSLQHALLYQMLQPVSYPRSLQLPTSRR